MDKMEQLSEEPYLLLSISRPGQLIFWPFGFRSPLTEQDSEKYQYIFTASYSHVCSCLALNCKSLDLT